MQIIVSDCNKKSTIDNRFYQWFDSFKVIKFLNFSHTNYYCKIPVCKVASDFLQKTKQYSSSTEDARTLLKVFRKLDREK